MLRVGLAGLGIHGIRYANHLLRREIPRMTLAAVSRADAGAGHAFAAEHGIAFVADPLALATHPGLDAVIVSLRPEQHAPCALACLDAGRPVLVEKPLAHDVSSAGAVVARAQDRLIPRFSRFRISWDLILPIGSIPQPPWMGTGNGGWFQGRSLRRLEKNSNT